MKHFRILFILGMCFAFLLILPLPCRAAAENTIRDGVYIQGISVGGMTEEEALQIVNDYFEAIAGSDFTIVCLDGEEETVTVSDWDFQWDAESAVSQALHFGSEGSLIQRYKSQMDLKYGNVYLEVAYSVSSEAVVETLEGDQIAAHDIPAVNATFTHEGDGFVVASTEKNGTVTDSAATLPLVLDQFAGNLSVVMSVTVITREDEPSVTTEDIDLIQDELGTFTTSYSSSNANRKSNIAVAAGYLNGTLVQPGESLSVSTAIRKRTEENGYKMAAQYSSGESEEAIGGGVCQVSTTLYNALLRAELQIDERHNHSMVVSYVDYGTDAAIAEGLKDLVFTNNLEYPIYIEGIADGSNLTFTIYGVETRDENRVVTYEAKTTSIVWPTEKKVKYSKDIKSGKYVVSGTVRPAVTATLTKVVTVNGEEVERTLLHTDRYSSSQQTITYGTG